jgi:transcriptional regulator with XRE-family HTH domain
MWSQCRILHYAMQSGGTVSIESLVDHLPEAVGRRVREARAERGWTLDQFADRSGVSRRMIVNVEAGTTNASLATLLRLASALHISLADLVGGPAQDQRLVVSQAAARTPLWRGDAGGSAVMVASADTPDMLELWEWTLEPGESYASEPHRPGTHELLHVTAGQLTLTVEGRAHILRSGDAASLGADVAHEYANNGRRSVRFTMTVLEPLTRVRP